MGNILLLCTDFFGTPAATGLCARALAKELESQGHHVGIVSVDSDEVIRARFGGAKEISVPYKKPKPAGTPRNIIVKAWRFGKLLLHTFYPKYNKDIVKKTTNIVKELCRKNQIDAMVSVYFPLFTVLSGYKIKKHNRNIKFVVYELDSVADGIASGGKWHKLVEISYKRAMAQIYKLADRVIIMKSHETHWLKEHKAFSAKMQVSDIPVLVAPDVTSVNRKDGEVHLLYSGALSSSYRSPEMLIEAFTGIDCDGWRLDFYSKGCDAELKAAEMRDGRICSHGYISKEELDAITMRADILVSIGNKVSNSVPSKIITYMSYGKPIIHFSLQENDVCLEYLTKYPAVLIIKHNDRACDIRKK